MPFEDDPYAERLFWSVGVRNWFERHVATAEPPSFGRKLLIIIGREGQPTRFLDSRIGQKLRERLGLRARIVLNGQYEDVAAIAFERDGSPADVWEQLKRFLPPRLVEDFVILDFGMRYCIGDQPITCSPSGRTSA